MIYSSRVKNRKSGNTEMTSEALTLRWWIWGRVESILKWTIIRVPCFFILDNMTSCTGKIWLTTRSNKRYHLSLLTISCYSPLYATKNTTKQTNAWYVEHFSRFLYKSDCGVGSWVHAGGGELSSDRCINSIPSGILGRQEEVRATPRLQRGSSQSSLQQERLGNKKDNKK